MLYPGKFRNNSPFSSGVRLDFIELQDVKLTKNENFYKRDVSDVIIIFTGRLMK